MVHLEQPIFLQEQGDKNTALNPSNPLFTSAKSLTGPYVPTSALTIQRTERSPHAEYQSKPILVTALGTRSPTH